MEQYGYPSSGGRGDRFANDEKIDWPLCDACGTSMTQMPSEPYVARFRCHRFGCDFYQRELSFASCRHSDRYCAWELLHAYDP